PMPSARRHVPSLSEKWSESSFSSRLRPTSVLPKHLMRMGSPPKRLQGSSRQGECQDFRRGASYSFSAGRESAMLSRSMQDGPILVAFSGGLDTSWCVVHLREQYGREIVTAVVDTGGFDAAELARIEARSKELGAARHLTIDGTRAVFGRFVTNLVAANCLRGGVYPLCVSAERVVQSEEIARAASEIGVAAVAHGSTGAGNDQIRFDVAFGVMLPGVEILAPVRELALSRQQEFDVLAAHGFPTKLEAKTYSVNRGLWGTTIGGGGLHDAGKPVPSDCWQDTKDPDAARAGGETIA